MPTSLENGHQRQMEVGSVSQDPQTVRGTELAQQSAPGDNERDSDYPNAQPTGPRRELLDQGVQVSVHKPSDLPPRRSSVEVAFGFGPVEGSAAYTGRRATSPGSI